MHDFVTMNYTIITPYTRHMLKMTDVSIKKKERWIQDTGL